MNGYNIDTGMVQIAIAWKNWSTPNGQLVDKKVLFKKKWGACMQLG